MSGAFDNNSDIQDKKIKVVPTPAKEIGIDTNNQLFANIVNAGQASKIDIAELQSFSTASRSRDEVYNLLDTMGEDAAISAVLETYAEDSTEYNDNGRIMWAESSNSDISAYVNFLLTSMCVDKNIYKWVYSLCKYGDLYLRLYRKSEYEDAIFDAPKKDKEVLNEQVNIKAFCPDDKFVHYIEMCPNPANIFELTRFGKTAGYIETETSSAVHNPGLATPGYYRYSFKQGDVNVYAATEFVHACLEDNTSRVPEEVDIFLDEYYMDENEREKHKMSYKVRRGQSLLYPVFKLWRELQLLENSILLNRVTKSSLVRLIKVNVGDMPKEMIQPHLQGLKSMLEQKSSLSYNGSMTEYTNPGPIENNVYVPVHGEVGNISVDTLSSGDPNVKDLADLEYYMRKFYGALRVPRQFMGQTDDDTGFNGGTSLSLTSSRYAKMIKRIQNTIIQAVTDAINLMLLDSGLTNYVNQFQLHMVPPATQEERTRRENLDTRVSYTQNVMNLVQDIDNVPTKLKMLKSLLSGVVPDDEFIQLLQDEIDKLEQQVVEDDEMDIVEDDESDDIPVDMSVETDSEDIETLTDLPKVQDITDDTLSSNTETAEVESELSDNQISSFELPTPDEIGIDFSTIQ